ncbi:hypothetical protein [Acuticoccus sp. I52.16.1]|uniref:hypothetical protein n=1 Tax=Acuticoccus sp. I52.16.1 TaxID=2928472 RepID=UPI001FD11A21|nr:hypothetical protein [Acuticoccus sp. I52.16.1]UOM34950.1 hypothetical protein MRB58_01685 [Acuticoccus sp. I52.16.1]
MNGMMQHFTVLRSEERPLDFASVLDIVTRELVFRNAEAHVGEDTLAITVGGTRVLMMARRTRYEAPDDGLAPLRVWEPSAALGAHVAHVAMTVTPRDASELAALLAMKVGLTLAAAVSKASGDVLAVHSRPNDVYMPPDVVGTVLAAFAAGEVPHEILVQYAPYHPQNDGLAGTVGMMTKGLTPLTGFEIAVAPTLTGRSADAYHVAAAAVRRQLVEGVALRDGETMQTATGAVRVRLVAEWLIPGVPMAVLLPAGALVEEETLCVRAELVEAMAADVAPGPAPRRRGLLTRLLQAGLRRDRRLGGGAAV